MASTYASRAKAPVTQPPWQVPTRDSPEPMLKVYNSLTKTKVRSSSFKAPALELGYDGELSSRRPAALFRWTL